MAKESGPLSTEQIDELIQNIRKMDTLDIEIEKAGRAGIDVSDAKKRAQETREALLKLKAVYAPTRAIK